MINLEVVGQGATTKIYRDGGTAIKLYVNAPSDEADNEAANQRFAYNAGLPVPIVYGVRKLDDNAVALDMEYIDCQTLMQPGMDKKKEKMPFALWLCSNARYIKFTQVAYQN